MINLEFKRSFHEYLKREKEGLASCNFNSFALFAFDRGAVEMMSIIGRAINQVSLTLFELFVRSIDISSRIAY